MKKIRFFGIIGILACSFLMILSIIMFKLHDNSFKFTIIVSLHKVAGNQIYATDLKVFSYMVIASMVGMTLIGILRYILFKNKTLSIISSLTSVFAFVALLVYFFNVNPFLDDGWSLNYNNPAFIIVANPTRIISIVGIVLLGITGIYSVISIVITFRIKNLASDKTVNHEKISKSFLDTQETEDISENDKNLVKNANLVDNSFTSTPNDETYNIADKLQKLREDLAGGIFDERLFNTDSETNDTEIKREDNLQYDGQNIDEEIDNDDSINLNERISEDKVLVEEDHLVSEEADEFPREPQPPVDPYRQTIIPRRSLDRKVEYKKPIGNKPFSELSQPSRERREAKYDSNYQGKVFLGDSDRIWEAMKKQKRLNTNSSPQIEAPSNPDDSSKIEEVQIETTITPELAPKKVIDPLSENQQIKNNDPIYPTIDWDE